MLAYVVLDGNLLDEVVLDENWLDELYLDSNLFVNDDVYTEQFRSNKERNSSKCQSNDELDMSQSIRGFVKAK